jgi:hypothetical protein
LLCTAVWRFTLTAKHDEYRGNSSEFDIRSTAKLDPLHGNIRPPTSGDFKADMISFLAQERALACHPQTPSQWVSTIKARLSEADDRGIAITYSLEGEISHLCLPAQRAPSRVDGLWQHTCFEAFIAVQGAPAYHEFNFAPSREWAAYAFRVYRDSGPLPQASDPQITIRTSANRFELDALIRRESLPPLSANARLLLALSAVIEDKDGALSYWALKHPLGPPDFHDAGAFVLELDPHVAAGIFPAYTVKP